jgi:hypothetical protein
MASDDTTITRGELIKELRIRNHATPALEGMAMVNNIIDRRSSKKPADPCGDKQWMGDEKITVEEMCDAMHRFNWADPSAKALRIFNDIKSHREPQWQMGDVVKDADGKLFERLDSTRNSSPYVWRSMTGGIHTEAKPKRPLKRMVEEA